MPKSYFPGYQTSMYKKQSTAKRVATAKKHLARAKRQHYDAQGMKRAPLFKPLPKGWHKRRR